MKVAILGWYGHGNLGDEAILEGLKLLLQDFGATDFTVLNDTIGLPELYRKANSADLFVLGGGELINRDYLSLCNAPGWEEGIKAPKIVVGCGVNANNASEIEEHVVKSLSSFKYIGLRDTVAVGILSGIPALAGKVHLSLGPSLILASHYGIEWKPANCVAAVIPTERVETTFDNGILTTGIIERTKQKLAEELMADGISRVNLLAFGGDDNDDLESCRVLESHLAPIFEVTVSRPSTPKEALEELAGCVKAYTYRLHGMMLAYSLGIPFTCFGYHRKVKRVYQTLIELTPQQAIGKVRATWDEAMREFEKIAPIRMD